MNSCLNRSYRLIWSDVRSAWVAVAETTRGRGKRSGRPGRVKAAIFAIGLLGPAVGVAQLPTGGKIVGGAGSVAASGTTMTVTQTTDRMAANWQSFSIGKGNTVNFIQPNSNSVALNRVLGSDVSVIQGALNANGQLFLVNPNGVLFTPDAHVSVGALVASTLSITTEDFMAGNYRFDGASSNAIVNRGNITAHGDGTTAGTVALIAAKIVNQGSITAHSGNVLMGAGNRVTLNLGGQVSLDVEQGALDALIEQGGAIKADGGRVYLTAKAAGDLASSVINHTGVTEARALGPDQTGQISLLSDHSIINTGTLSANGANSDGGSVHVVTKNLIDAGVVDVSSENHNGGVIQVQASGRILQTSASRFDASGSLQGGEVRLEAAESAFLSGTSKAMGNSGKGGDISLTAADLKIAGAELNASGAFGGGRIRVGGGWQGNDSDLTNAQRTSVVSSTIDVSAVNAGDGGTAVVWADGSTVFGGAVQATGGQQQGDGGRVEVSGKGDLTFGGTVDAKAFNGRAGTLLLDPRNIEIVESVGGLSILNLADPTPSANEFFGQLHLLELMDGSTALNRVAIASSRDDIGATDAGAIYVYNTQTGALVSTLVGSSAGDEIGLRGLVSLENGNFLVMSPGWNNGAVSNVGAITWVNGQTGLSGVVSASNSLIGSTAEDAVGSAWATVLQGPNKGNYVVGTPRWDNGGAQDAGAVTWGNGSTGVSGVISASNSLVGSKAQDQIGTAGTILALTNGNYVFRSLWWDNGNIVDAGAVTWANGATGGAGPVSAANSLVGTKANDRVGLGWLEALPNGNYVAISSSWANGSAANAGAVTLGNGATGTFGAVSASNSLVGSKADDQVGGRGVTVLSNSNYVVASMMWDNGSIVDAGAVTWGSGTTGVTGVVSASNSLVGGRAGDVVGNGGVTALSNGNYLVSSPFWDNGSVQDVGALTWGSGTAGVKGLVSATNSLVGSKAQDNVGSVVALTNGNYVAVTPKWDNGSVADVGAVTWADGTTGIRGAVTAANSLIGSKANDQVGGLMFGAGVVALTNGNYVVPSPSWDNGSVADVGAVTWGNGTTGTRGVVSSSNSLIGSTTKDQVGSNLPTALTNGNYVVVSPNWINGSAAGAGAVTWGNGATGTVGVVSASNSLVGNKANDKVGMFGITTLSNGNYVVKSNNWANGTALKAGAVSWGNGLGGTVGVVSSANSLVGTKASDQVGTNIVALVGGNYVVASPNWDNGSLTNTGAVTWGDGTVGTSGLISEENSFIGVSASDVAGDVLPIALSDGRALVRSSRWNQLSPTALKWAGRVDIIKGGAGASASGLSSPQLYSTNPDADSVFQASDILALLNAGTNVVLQANNDITLSADLIANNANGNGGALTLQAGRSVSLNGSITTDNGNLTLIANDTAANGVVSAHRDAGAAAVTMAANTAIAAGSGAVSITLRNGAGNTHNTPGVITLSNITAGSLAIDSVNFGAINAENKVYDRSGVATLTGNSLTGLAFTAGTNLAVSTVEATFADANVGNGKTVTASPISVSGFNGASTSNLLLNGTVWQPTTTADITAKTVTLSGLSATNKVYDATTTAATSGTPSLTGVIDGDSVSLGGTVTAAFANKNVGTGKSVSLSGLTLTGGAAANYVLSYPTTLTADITKADLALNNVTAAVKVYDGTTNATLSGTPSITPLGSDNVNLIGALSGTFSDKNAGSNKTVVLSNSMSLGGADAGNYNLVAPSGLTATITPASLRVNANNFLATGVIPVKQSESGCVDGVSCVAGISLDGSNLGLTFASGVVPSNYQTTLQIENPTGNLDVTRSLSWTGMNLVLSAAADINIRNTLTANGATDKVTLLYGQGSSASGNTSAYRFGLTDTGFTGKLNLKAGQNFSTKLGRDGATQDWTVITALGSSTSSNDGSLQGMRGALAGRFALGADIDANATSTWNSGAGWTPIGNATTKFTGQFDGLGHTISNLAINRPNVNIPDNNYQGLFGWSLGAKLENIGIESPTIAAARDIGGLVGVGDGTDIQQAYVRNALLVGERLVGGLAGELRLGSSVSDSFATGETRGNGASDISYHGGLVGTIQTLDANLIAANVRRTFADVDVATAEEGDGSRVAGGLTALFHGAGVIEDSFALGSVRGRNATSSDGVGGLVGRLGSSTVGAAPSLSRNYAAGSVSATSGTVLGGLVGAIISGTVTDSVWDVGTTGRGTSAGGGGAVGKSTEQLQTLNTFGSWSITFTDSKNYSGSTDFRRPQLSFDGSGVWKMNPKYIPYTLTTIGSGSYTYNAQSQVPVEWSSRAILGDAYAAWVLGTDYQFTHNSTGLNGFTNAGTYSSVGVTFVRGGANNYLPATSNVPASGGNAVGNLTIDKAALTVRANDDARFVTQTDAALYGGVRYSGFVGSETPSVLSGTLAIARSDSTNNNAGTYTLTPSGLSSSNYDVTYEPGSYEIVAADKMLVKAGVTTTVYGETPNWSTPVVQYVAANNTTLSLNGVAQGNGSFVFAEPDAPANTVSFTLQASGTTLSGSGNINVGSYSVSGSNFVDNTPNFAGSVVYSGNVVVTPKPITVSYAPTKTYDRTTAFTPTVTPSGVLPNDQVGFTGAGVFETNQAGSNIRHAITLTPTGADKANYVVQGARVTNSGASVLIGTNGQINKATLSVSNISAVNKTYDGTVSAVLSGTPAKGTLANASDVVNITGTAVGVFGDKNVGDNKPITVSGLSLTGADASNYNLAQPTGLAANISQATISSVTGIAAENRLYDGGTDATLITSGAVFTGKIAGDDLSVATATGSFTTKDAGNNKTVTISGISLGGADVGNYQLTNSTATATANIGKATISAVTGITAADKVYDGNTSASLSTASAVFSGVIGNDALTVSAASGAFSDKNAGENKTVNIVGIALGGADVANYQLASTTATAFADITAKPLTITGSAAQNKVYDATTSATITVGTLNGLVGSETLTVSALGVFGTKGAGDAKPVTVTYSLGDGSNGGLAINYSLPGETLLASVTRRDLLVQGLGVSSRDYDGTQTAQIFGSPTVSPLAGDVVDVTGSATGSFDTKDVGTNKLVTVSVSGLSKSGADASNYNLVAPTGLAGTINPKTLSIVGTSVESKTYDGDAFASVTAGELSGLIGSEDLSVLGFGEFASQDVVANNFVRVDYTLLDGDNGGLASNYVLNSENIAASINPRLVTISMADGDKVFDGTDTASPVLSITSGLVGNETLGVTGVATFNSQLITRASQITLNSVTLSDGENGGLASNYRAETGQTLAAKIIPNPRFAGEIEKITTPLNAEIGRLGQGTGAEVAGGAGTPVAALVRAPQRIVDSTAGSTSGTGSSAPASVTVSGGLAFVEINQAGLQATDSSGGNPVPIQAVSGAGRDPSGFMRVFVVRGGVNLPDGALDTSRGSGVSGQGSIR